MSRTLVIAAALGALLVAVLVNVLDHDVLEKALRPRPSTPDPTLLGPEALAVRPSSWPELRFTPAPPPPTGPSHRHGDVAASFLRLRGTVRGPLAFVTVHGAWTNTNPTPLDGLEVTETVATPAVAALHSFWITEEGRRIDADLRTRTGARLDYDRTVHRRRDPGLLEQVGEGRVRFSLYPVLPDGTPKEAAWSEDAVVDQDADGWRRLPLPVGSHRTVALDLDLTVDEPAGVLEWRLPPGVTVEDSSPRGGRLVGRWRDVRPSTPTLVVAWRSLPAPRVDPSAATPVVPAVPVTDEGAVATLALPVGDGWLPVTFLVEGDEGRCRLHPAAGADEAPALRFERLDAPPLGVAADAWRRILAAARIFASWHETSDGAGLAALVARERLVSPISSLYANPAGTGDSSLEALADENRAGNASAAEAAAPTAPLHRPSPLEGLFGGGEVTFGTFRRSRERANGRACMANVKTLAGALEMLLLDEAMTQDDLVDRFPSRGALRARPLANASDTVVPAWSRSSLRRPGRWTDLSTLAPTLVGQGYLQSIPHDPGQGGEATAAHYVITASGVVFCRVHGTHSGADPYGRSARESLVEAGETSPAVLAMAPAGLPAVRGSRRPLFEFFADPVLCLCLALFVWLLGALVPGARPLAAFALTFFLAAVGVVVALGSLPRFQETFAAIRVWGLGLGFLGAALAALALPSCIAARGVTPSKDDLAAMDAEAAVAASRMRSWGIAGLVLLALSALLALGVSRHPGEPLFFLGLAVVALIIAGLVHGLLRFAALASRLAEGPTPWNGPAPRHVAAALLGLLLLVALPFLAPLLPLVPAASAAAFLTLVERTRGTAGW